VARRFSQIVTVVLLGVMVTTNAAAMCLRLGASMHAPSAACHHSSVPSNPQSADYRCCASRHPSALLTNVSSRPALHSLEAADAGQLPVHAGDSDAFPPAIAPSTGPPGILILRI
jgi:hypothetical protein